MLATVPSATLLGVDGIPVTVEVHVADGLPCFTVVGLPDASCREARDRVRAALLTSGFSWPDKRITVNLAPTSVRKVGSALDLAIAVGVLVASEQLPAEARRGAGLRRRARPRRHGAPRAGGAVAGRRARRPPRSWCRRRRRPRPSWWAATASGARPDLRRMVEALKAEAPWPSPARPAVGPPARPRPPTWPTCGATRSPAPRSRSPPPAATTCSWSARRARARRCSPSGCPGLLPDLDDAAGARGHPGPLRRRAAAARAASCGARRSGPRTTAPPRSP